MNRILLNEVIPAEESRNWYSVCSVSDLNPFMGVRALVHGEQIAIFMVRSSREIFAINALDPFSGAAVLSRGIVGDIKGELVVASPIYKQHFNLRTGECLEDRSVRVPVYPVRLVDQKIQIAFCD